VSAGERQELLAEYGLTEEPSGGYGLTPRSLQQGLSRAYKLRGEGSVECREVLALDPADERRAQLALNLQIEAFSEAYFQNS
jgi:hypothetical protein